jgi:CheY-like chemotaxis protein
MAQPPQPAILVVDDDADICLLMQRALTHRGYPALIATTEAEALAVFRREPAERIGCVIVDLTLANPRGESIIRTLRQLQPAIRIIVMSAQRRDELAQAAARLGAAGVLSKPFTLSELWCVLQDAFVRR